MSSRRQLGRSCLPRAGHVNVDNIIMTVFPLTFVLDDLNSGLKLSLMDLIELALSIVICIY